MKNTLVGIAAGLLIGASIAPAAAHHGDDLRKIRNQIAVLKQKTQEMDRDGFYNGIILGNQVISLCPAGSTAVWETAIEEISMLEDCLEPQQQERALRRVGG